MPRTNKQIDAPANPTRRRLLTAAPVVGAAALAAPAASASTDGAEREADRDPTRLDYRETDHVKAYYARARG